MTSVSERCFSVAASVRCMYVDNVDILCVGVYVLEAMFTKVYQKKKNEKKIEKKI